MIRMIDVLVSISLSFGLFLLVIRWHFLVVEGQLL